MSAHIYTILLDAATSHTCRVKYLQHALGYAPGCDLLDYEDWVQLNDLYEYRLANDDANEDLTPLSDEIRSILLELIAKYAQQCVDLGKPVSYEAWVVAKYPNSFEALAAGR